VRGGNQVLVSNLAGRSDVAQIVANHPIAVEEPNFFTDAEIDTVVIPQAYLWNINVTRAPNVWAYGVRGENIVVAEIDTGVQWDHPTLIIHYRGWNGVSVNHNYNWFDPYGQSTSAPADENGHGTHVMGTMVGADGANINQIGMAPGAKYISCKGYDNVSHYLLTTELLQCAQWMLAPTDLSGANPDAAKRPHIINNSWGGGAADYWFTGAVDAWRAAGIFPQFSNGNDGPACSTASSPGDYWNVFTAGATTDTNAIAGFSSRGPALNTGILKPDISAPGDNIRSSVPTNLYANYSGTSMASPHVAGAVALLWSSNPELIGQIDLTAWILRQTAAPLTTSEGCGGDGPADVPNNTYGYGLLDIKAAVDLARTGTVTPDWVRVDPVGGDIPAGSSGAVTLVFTPDASWALGSTYATLWLVSDEPYNPDIRIPVEMNVVEPVFIYLPFMRK
jgi:subtilisin family serine protease